MLPARASYLSILFMLLMILTTLDIMKNQSNKESLVAAEPEICLWNPNNNVLSRGHTWPWFTHLKNWGTRGCDWDELLRRTTASYRTSSPRLASVLLVGDGVMVLWSLCDLSLVRVRRAYIILWYLRFRT